jgi:hypothetical protein
MICIKTASKYSTSEESILPVLADTEFCCSLFLLIQSLEIVMTVSWRILLCSQILLLHCCYQNCCCSLKYKNSEATAPLSYRTPGWPIPGSCPALGSAVQRSARGCNPMQSPTTRGAFVLSKWAWKPEHAAGRGLRDGN